MRKFLLAAAAVSASALSACSTLQQPIRAATGSISHTICSETFVSGLEPERIYEESLRPNPGMGLIAWGLHYDVDRTRREVRTTFVGAFANRAIYRDGMGCLLVQGAQPAVSLPPEEAAPVSKAAAPLLPQIAAAAPVEPADEKLRAALDRAFAERDQPPYRRTRAIVVLRDERIIAERYAPGIGVDTPLRGRSLTKSVMSALIGILVRERRLCVGERAPVPEWQQPGDPRRAITVDHLLRMTSGLAWGDEMYSGWDKMSRMENIERDMAAFAAALPLAAMPGRRWNYSGGDYLILGRIFRDAVGGHPGDVLRFAREKLFEPLGMRSVTFEFDATGTPVSSFTTLASARDWARFGLLYLNDGVAGGRRILPEGWVRYSSSQTLETGYGAGFWTNVAIAGKVPAWGIAWDIPSAPRDAFFGRGYLGQFLVVVPSGRLVVVRLGATQRPDADREVGQLVADVVAALHP